MRWYRGCHHLGNRCFSFPSECSHLVSIESSSLFHGSNMPWFGKSYAASSSAEIVKARKTQRRVTKDERRLMVEKYVNKYQELNEGKFPRATDVQKNTGGSYYIVRQIVQELIYNSNTSSTKPKPAVSLENSSMNKDEISGKASQAKKIGELVSPISKVDILDDKYKNFESKEVSQPSVSVLASLTVETQPIPEVDVGSSGVGRESDHVINEHKSSLPYDPENDIKPDTVHGDRVKFDGLQPKSEPQKPTESQVSGRESHSASTPTKNAEPPRPYSLWRNLRSFANEILGSLNQTTSEEQNLLFNSA